MTTEAMIGHGTRFQRFSEDSPSEWEDIGELKDPGSANRSRDAVDATHTRSPEKYREFIGGLRDAGEATLTIALVPGSYAYQQLNDDFETDASQWYRIVFPDPDLPDQLGSENWMFKGLVTNLEDGMPLDGEMTVAVTIKRSGKPQLLSALDENPTD